MKLHFIVHISVWQLRERGKFRCLKLWKELACCLSPTLFLGGGGSLEHRKVKDAPGSLIRGKVGTVICALKLSLFSPHSYGVCLFVCLFWRDGLQLDGDCTFTRFLDHTQRRITVVSTPLDEWSARRRDLYLYNKQHSQQADVPGGIRTNNLSRGAAADLRLRPPRPLGPA
jgi:hypothetical protein